MAREFEERLFTGRDLLIFMDMEGIGVGATKMIVQMHEIKHKRHPDTYRALEGPEIEKRLDRLQEAVDRARAIVAEEDTDAT